MGQAYESCRIAMFVLKSYNSATVPGPSATETKLCRASVCYYTNNTRFLELYITHDVSSDESLLGNERFCHRV